jgi:hypothetical protein
MPCDCQVSPEVPALISIASAPQVSHEVLLVGDTLTVFAPVTVFRAEEDYTPPDCELSRHSQSVLCTFLI